MDVSFYTAAVSVGEHQARLGIHSNNLANLNTDGFRSKRPAFSTLMTGTVRGTDENPVRGYGTQMIQAETYFKTGGYKETGRYLDYAIEGNGFFALQDPVTGAFSYSRDGSFTKMSMQVQEELTEEEIAEAEANGETVNPTRIVTKWFLSDGIGRLVLGEDGGRIELEDDEYHDTIVDKTMLPIGIFDFINYNGAQSSDDNILSPVKKNGQVRKGTGTLVHGFLEVSNTDVAYEFSKIVETQRTFNFLLRVMTTSDEITTTVNNLR